MKNVFQLRLNLFGQTIGKAIGDELKDAGEISMGKIAAAVGAEMTAELALSGPRAELVLGEIGRAHV